MKQRLNVSQITPDLYAAVLALDTKVKQSGIDLDLLHLIKLRASQINGCAYCVDMHVKESLADGIPAQKLHLVSVWRESPLFDDRERAVLEWTESLTLIAQTGASDSAYEALRAHFSEEQIAQLIVAIGTINIWNRIAVSSRLVHR
ncbi:MULTISPECIES: carboxymuconolactone decarboxylase family protein [Paracoccus]|uniref:Carboxymuconolactone decarboxylase family protein n=1 Tax=Paracoccus pacificus TaxID=1463598 RepID=A0ABW4R3R3_9RHOB|nr:carboxymuconolactone decarboxylase family protein [Paracoccus aerodenitrificans]TNE43524.1 MAG: carboxymuconolactone decarboxylase family protein [Sphingomonadales bacterium]WBU65581.1 carboxymuconolactone decarboxylase family protein [Paracoccus aerodenitrificans]